MNNNKITIAGATNLLKYTFASFLAMEEVHGVNVYADDTWLKPSPRLTCVLIWGALQHLEKVPTVQEIAAGLSFEEARRAQKIVVDAIKDALPEPEKKPSDQPSSAT